MGVELPLHVAVTILECCVTFSGVKLSIRSFVSFLIIGNTPRNALTLQSEKKTKACLGKNFKISLPKAYQIKEKSKTLVVKGVPTEFTDDEFKQILDHNKIKHGKAERKKSRRDGRSLQMFQIELSDPAEAEAIISNNITCPQTGIIF